MIEFKQSSNPDAAKTLLKLFCMTDFVDMVTIYAKTQDKTRVFHTSIFSPKNSQLLHPKNKIEALIFAKNSKMHLIIQEFSHHALIGSEQA